MRYVAAVLCDNHFTHALELYMTCISLDAELVGTLYDLHFCGSTGNFLTSFEGMLVFPMGNKSKGGRE